MAVSADEVLEMYRWMVKIRTFDERVGKESLGGQVPGFVHQYCGEEAVAVGVCRGVSGPTTTYQHSPRSRAYASPKAAT